MNVSFTGFPKVSPNARGIIQNKITGIIPLTNKELSGAQKNIAAGREIFEDLEHFSPPQNMRTELVSQGTSLLEKGIAPYKRIFNSQA